jgi:Arc/MetJ family transcription regulator
VEPLDNRRRDELGIHVGGVGTQRIRVVYPKVADVYTAAMTKRLIDVDDDALKAARAKLGTSTIKDTVNEALRRAARERSAELTSALSTLSAVDLDDRSVAWR